MDQTADYELFAHLNPEDERPLHCWLSTSGAKLLRFRSETFPLEQVAWDTLEANGRDECLSLWYEDVFTAAELAGDYSRDRCGVNYDTWDLPVIRYQRQWYWKKQASIFAIRWDCSYEAFRLNWPESAFTPEMIADFNQRLELLREHFWRLHGWLGQNYRRAGRRTFIGRGAAMDSEELRVLYGAPFGIH